VPSLIDPDQLIEQLRAGGYGEGWLFDQIRAAPPIKPQVVVNISGGLNQGSSADYPVEVYTLDFDTKDGISDDSTGVEIDGEHAYVGGSSADLDPEFVRSVIEAPRIFFMTGEPVCTECDGDGYVYDLDTRATKKCEPCDGTGEAPDADCQTCAETIETRLLPCDECGAQD
jgi:hypothetical protein